MIVFLPKQNLRKVYYCTVLTILVLSALLIAFESSLSTMLWRIRCPSPVEWNNLEISFPKGVRYEKTSEYLL
jgi:hypothetical protein